MREQDLNVLEQYHIESSSTRKIRGAVLCDTKEGPYVLQETTAKESRVQTVFSLQKMLIEEGFDRIDLLRQNEEGNFITTSETGLNFLVRRWYVGRECSAKKESDLLEGAKNLARLHLVLAQLEAPEQSFGKPPLYERFESHSQELTKIRRFIRRRVDKGVFEQAFLSGFEQMRPWQECAIEGLRSSAYYQWRSGDDWSGELVHGSYNYHNLIFADQEVATVNFHHFCRDIQMEDLYYYLRKCMEKQEWRVLVGEKILRTYDSIKPISQMEWEYLKYRFVYPEKYWKIANNYYQSNKAYLSDNHAIKLQVQLHQMQEKSHFLQSIFSFHL